MGNWSTIFIQIISQIKWVVPMNSGTQILVFIVEGILWLKGNTNNMNDLSNQTSCSKIKEQPQKMIHFSMN